MRFFVTGTDTDVGKTYCIALLTRALRQAGLDTVALKPICCGPRDDVDELSAAMDAALSHDTINPVWLREPAAPLIAARCEGLTVDLGLLTEWFSSFSASSVLIEGAGGWLVPVGDRTTVADLALNFHLPVIVVVANRLGCLNHALLTIESVRAKGLTCAGFILNNLAGDADSVAVQTNRQLLEELAGVPLLFEIQRGQTEIDLAALQVFNARRSE